MVKRYYPEIPKYNLIEITNKKNNYCICVPVINEGQKFKNFLGKLKKYSNIVDILILDGGSTDDSVNLKFLRKNKVSALLVLNQSGKLSAQLRMGYYYSLKRKYKGILTIDGNGKDDPIAIPQFIKELSNGYDYLQGSRFLNQGKGINTPIIRYLAIRLLHAPILSLTSGFWYTDTTPGYRGYSNKLLNSDRLKIFRDMFYSYELLAYISAQAPRLGYKTKEIPIIRSYPKTGRIPTKIKGIK